MTLLLDPNIAYLLLALTIFFATLAVLVPGTGLLEVATLVVGTLAVYAMLHLALNWWALGILVLGIAAMGCALWHERWAALCLTMAALGFLVGSVTLFRVPERWFAVHPALALTVSLLLGGYFWFGVRKGLEAWHRQPLANTPDKVIGQIGETRTAVHHTGSVHVGGEDWSARSAQPIPAGVRVRVVRREGLTLIVEPVEGESAKGDQP